MAAIANVSIATVSNVIHGKDTLYAPDTAEIVWSAVQELDYRPNKVARSLARRSTETLGVVIDRPHGRLTSNSYMTSLLDGFLEYAVPAGYQIKLISLLKSDQHSAPALLEDGSVDGLALFAPPTDSFLIAWAQITRLPVVVVGSAPADLQLPCLDVDDCQAACSAVRWVIAQGHRRVGMICGPDSQLSACRREEGYRRALQEAGIKPRAEWIYAGDYLTSSAIVGMTALMALPERPTAVFCWNTGMALEALRAAQTLGLHVPADVSLIGFDDVEPASWSHPPLTVVQQPTAEMGSRAAELLIRRIQKKSREAGLILFEGTLIIRQSVAPLSNGADETAAPMLSLGSYAVHHLRHGSPVR